MITVLSYLKRYRIAIAVALTLMLIELTVELLQPLIISKIIDDGIVKENLSVVLWWGGVLVGCSLLSFAAGITNSFYAAHTSQSFGYNVRESLFDKVQSFSFANFNRFPTSSLITRLTNDVTILQNTVFMSLRIMMRAPLLVIGGVIMAFVVNWKLALILLATVPFLIVFLNWAMKKAGALFRIMQDKLDNVNAIMQENLSGIRLIKAFQRAVHEAKRFASAGADLMVRTMSALRITESTMPVILLVMNAGIMAILWFGTKQVSVGGASAGEVVAVVNYAMRTAGALSIISMVIMNISRANASARRVADVLELDIDLADTEHSDASLRVKQGAVVFDRVSFRYPDNHELTLQELSFEVKPGQMIAVMGATGSGKSSLFQLIPRLYEATEGGVYIDGVDIRSMKLEQLRRQIGIVPQESLLFTGTVKDNIAWGKENATMDEIIDAARRAQIHDTIMNLPGGYDTMLGQKGVNLSGGQKQRLCIARAFVRKPKILLLDDSTSALDLRTEAMLLQALREVPCTTFIITQKISTTIGADAILLLEDGKLLTKGSHDELLRHSALYRRIYQSQFGEEAVKHVQGIG